MINVQIKTTLGLNFDRIGRRTIKIVMRIRYRIRVGNHLRTGEINLRRLDPRAGYIFINGEIGVLAMASRTFIAMDIEYQFIGRRNTVGSGDYVCFFLGAAIP